MGTSDLYNNFVSKTQSGASSPEDYVKALLLGGSLGGAFELVGAKLGSDASAAAPEGTSAPTQPPAAPQAQLPPGSTPVEQVATVADTTDAAHENGQAPQRGEADTAKETTREQAKPTDRSLPAPANARVIAEQIGKAAAKDTIRSAEPPAVEAAEAAYRDALARNKSEGEAEAAAKAAAERAVDVEVDTRMQELEAQGHGPQRHGAKITDAQLKDRANHGRDPMTGSTLDGVNKKADGTPKKHKVGKTATRVNSDADYVKGDEFIRESDLYKTEKARVEAAGATEFGVEVPLEDVYGKDYRSKLTGFTRMGPKNTNTDVPTDFTGGVLRAFFEFDPVTKSWDLVTMYPQPLNGS